MEPARAIDRDPGPRPSRGLPRLYIGLHHEGRGEQLWLPGVPRGPLLVKVSLHARSPKLATGAMFAREKGILGATRDRPPGPPYRKLPVILCRNTLSREAGDLLRGLVGAPAEQLALPGIEGEPEAGLLRRPRTRADCIDGPRPCPWVSCRHHLFLEVHPGSGSISLNHPGREPSDLAESCALDVADRGEALLLAEIGTHLGVTLERARQLEADALASMEAMAALMDIDLGGLGGRR